MNEDTGDRKENKRSSEKSLHEKYVQKLKEIGLKLGFNVMPLKTELGTADCVWRLSSTEPYKLFLLPVAAFEVICSENQKTIRGSLLNMIYIKPALAVFVLVKKGIKKHGERKTEKWLNRISSYVQKLKKNFSGILRIDIWDEEYIDRIYSQIVEKKIEEDVLKIIEDVRNTPGLE